MNEKKYGLKGKNRVLKTKVLKKETLYGLTLVVISAIVLGSGYISMNYLIRVSTNQYLEAQLESSKREAQEFSKLISFQIDLGIPRETVIRNVQKSIEGTNIESGFICMFDWSGKEVCHPNPEKIGQQMSQNQSFVRPINDGIDVEDFYNLLTQKRENTGGIRDFTDPKRGSEIIYLYPVQNTDWIIAAHANLKKTEGHLEDLKVNFILIYLLTSVIVILLSTIMVRYLGNYYEKELEKKNDQLTDELMELSKLNTSLTLHKQKASMNSNDGNIAVKDTDDKTVKSRLITYSKDKLDFIGIDQIAYINTENTVTTITCLDGKKYANNASLDELYSSLDSTTFFRANRQNILSVKGIDEILRFGNSQLKIKTKPENSIIISKNKVSEFKKWLNM
jgi:Tfp pilus assembly protein PilN